MAKNYESEITQFLKKYKADHPGTDARQRAGRARLWDRQLDTEALDGLGDDDLVHVLRDAGGDGTDDEEDDRTLEHELAAVEISQLAVQGH